MGGDKNVRRVMPGSSEKDANFLHLAMTSAARFVTSDVCTRFFTAARHSHHKRLGLAYKLRSRPAEENEANENFPTVGAPVGCNRKVMADHEKDNGNCHEGVVLGAQFGLSAERSIEA